MCKQIVINILFLKRPTETLAISMLSNYRNWSAQSRGYMTPLRSNASCICLRSTIAVFRFSFKFCRRRSEHSKYGRRPPSIFPTEYRKHWRWISSSIRSRAISTSWAICPTSRELTRPKISSLLCSIRLTAHFWRGALRRFRWSFHNRKGLRRTAWSR